MDLVQVSGTPEDVELGGGTFSVRLLTMREWASVSAFIKKHIPSPVTNALLAIQQAKNAGEPIGQAAQDELLDHAQRSALKWPPRLGTEAWFDAIGSIDGGDARLLYEVLSKTHLDFTEEKAKALAPKITGEEWGELIRVALFGTHPRPKGGGAETPPPTPPIMPTSGTG